MNYTFLQTQARVKRMRSLRRPAIPQTIHELANLLMNPQNVNFASTIQVPASRFFQQELVVNGKSVGVVFANMDAIQRNVEELATVELVGIDGTFKTVPAVPVDLRSFLTVQVVYKNVVSYFYLLQNTLLLFIFIYTECNLLYQLCTI